MISVYVALSLTVLSVAPLNVTAIGLLVAPVLMLSPINDRLILGAVVVHNGFVYLGTMGSFSFLGATVVDSQQAAVGVTFGNIIALICARPRTDPAEVPGRLPLLGRKPVFAVVGLCATILIAARFKHGIPLFEGNEVRLSGVASLNGYVAVLGGGLAIAASFLPRSRTLASKTITIVLFLAVLGTASRLLAVAALVGNTPHLLARSKNSEKTRHGAIRILVGVALAVAVIGSIYTLRTDTDVSNVYDRRIAHLEGVPNAVAEVAGSGTLLASRNGQVVFDRLKDVTARPPNGYTLGTILYNLNRQENPEIWTTRALGFDILGTVAVPFWAALFLDYGWLAIVLGAVTFSLVYRCARNRRPEAQKWLSLGLVFSSYGNYLLSLQFLVGLGLIWMLAAYSEKQLLGRHTVPPVTTPGSLRRAAQHSELRQRPREAPVRSRSQRRRSRI